MIQFIKKWCTATPLRSKAVSHLRFKKRRTLKPSSNWGAKVRKDSESSNDSSGVHVSWDIKRVKKELKEIGKWLEVQALMRPDPFMSLFFFVQAIVTVGLITWLFIANPIIWVCLLPITGPLFSRSLRSIGNADHEVSHNNITPWRKFNRFVGKYILMPLMYYCYDYYMWTHGNEHHPALSDSYNDPDFIPQHHESYDGGNVTIAFMKLMKPMVFDKRTWMSSAFGDIFNPKVSRDSKLIIFGFWIFVLVTISLLSTAKSALLFFLLWMLMRATFYHVHKVFVEHVDHYNLPTDSIIANSRIMPDGIIAYVLHPDGDNYHTPHHIFQNVPLANIKKLHKILMCLDEYRNGNIYKNYREVIMSLIK